MITVNRYTTCECYTCKNEFQKLTVECNRKNKYGHHFCSRECFNIFRRSDEFQIRNGKVVQCSNCGKDKYLGSKELMRSNEHYCDKGCMMEHRKNTGFYKGDNNANYKGGSVVLICPICNKEFIKKRGSYNVAIERNINGDIFCSRECADKNKVNLIHKDSRLDFICDFCGESFKTWGSQRIHDNKFCSTECRMKFYIGDKAPSWKGGDVVLTCSNCQIEYSQKRNSQRDNSNHTFCSKKCMTEFMVGANSAQWKGGISSFSTLLRQLPEYKEWRMRVFSRDSFTCCVCGTSGHSLNAHHIKHFKTLLQEFKIATLEDAAKCLQLWDIDNGVTLCQDCHKEAHKIIKQQELIRTIAENSVN